eukprot:TCONS_00012734-protein
MSRDQQHEEEGEKEEIENDSFVDVSGRTLSFIKTGGSPPRASPTRKRRSALSNIKHMKFVRQKSSSIEKEDEPNDTDKSTDQMPIIKSSSFRTHKPSPAPRYAIRTYSHTLNQSSRVCRADSFGASAVPRRLRSITNVNSDGEQVKTRRISTPELVNRRQMLRQKSMESLEQLKTFKGAIASRQQIDNSILSVNSNLDESRASTTAPNNVRPTKTITNFLRKISINSKSKHPVPSSPPKNRLLDDRETLISERDKVLEEWSESAKKCEELIDELDITLTELMAVKDDRDKQQERLNQLLQFYQSNLDEKDLEIEDLQTKIIELTELRFTLKKERDDYLKQRTDEAKISYQLARQIHEMMTEIEESNMEIEETKVICNQLHSQVSHLVTNIEKQDQLTMLILDTMVPINNNPHPSTPDDGPNKAVLNDLTGPDDVTKERDQLRNELDRIRKLLEMSSKNKHMSINFGDDNVAKKLIRTGSLNENVGFGMSETDNDNVFITDQDKILGSNKALNKLHNQYEQYEDIAICIDTFDSRTGLKLDNAYDEPRVMVCDVTKQLEDKWNIRKSDRILSVNGTSVHQGDKKVVEKLFKETVGRTISLVLRREKMCVMKELTDVEVNYGKQNDLGLQFQLSVKYINTENRDLFTGLENIHNGDVITKINSQDIDSILSAVIKKLAKKSNNKITYRIRRGDGTSAPVDSLPYIPRQNKSKQVSQSKSFSSITSSITPRKSTNESSAARNLINDISSKLPFRANSDAASTVPRQQNGSRVPTFRASFHGFSNIPPHQPPPPRFTKQKTSNLPSITIETPTNTEKENDKRDRLYSPERSNSFENFTQKIFADSNTPFDSANNKMNNFPTNENSENIEPPHRHSLYRPSPRIRRIEDEFAVTDRATRQYKSKSLYLEVLNRRSFAAPITLDDPPEPHLTGDINNRISLHADTLSSQQTLRNISGYATLPRKYKKKPSKKKATKSIRLAKSEDEKLGIKICGGNKVGIFISDILPGSAAAHSNLKVGDRIINMNSLDLTRATLDFATRVMMSNIKSTKVRMQLQEHENYLDVVQNSYAESLYVRTLHSYNATNLNEMSFKAGDILHITDTRYNFDEDNMTWTWYGARKVSSSKQTEGEIPAIEGFDGTKEVTEKEAHAHMSTSRNPLRRLSKSAQDLKRRFFGKKSSLRRRNTAGSSKIERAHHNNGIEDPVKRSSFYEILLEDPIRI